MKILRLLSLLLVILLGSCDRKFSDKEIGFKNNLYNRNWIEIKRTNLFGGLYSNYGERYQADWDLSIDPQGFAHLRTPKMEVRNIFIDTDSLMKWDKYKYRVVKAKADTLVLQYIPAKNDSINKPHNLTFITKAIYEKSGKQLNNSPKLTKSDTLFIQKLADSCKRNPLYRFYAETFPKLMPLVPNVKVDTTITNDGFHKEIEYRIQDFSSDIKYQHSYSGKFIVRENGKLAAFDVGMLAMDEEISPNTYKYIQQFMETKFQYQPATTLGIKHNTFVYFTFIRTPLI